ncbi:MAG: hypothetical protein ABIR80_08990, partial [Opitutaceae bacterium]
IGTAVLLLKKKGLPMLRGEFLSGGMARTPARFRVSIKDNMAKRSLKIELVDASGLWGERRYRIRVDGRDAIRVPVATLSEVFDRLRRWVVKRADSAGPSRS